MFLSVEAGKHSQNSEPPLAGGWWVLRACNLMIQCFSIRFIGNRLRAKQIKWVKSDPVCRRLLPSDFTTGQGKWVLRLRELPNTHFVALSGKHSLTQISVNPAHSTGVNNKNDSLLMLNNLFYRFIKEHAWVRVLRETAFHNNTNPYLSLTHLQPKGRVILPRSVDAVSLSQVWRS